MSPSPRRIPPARLGRRAVAAVEMALVAGPFTAFLLAVFGAGMHFFVQQALDYSVQAAARQVQIGQVPATYTAQDFLTNVLCPQFGVFQSCAGVYVDLRPVTDYETLSLAGGAPDAPASTGTTGFVFCPGQPGQLMYAHVVYLAPTIGGALLGSPGGLSPVVANAAFSNENPTGAPVSPAGGC